MHADQAGASKPQRSLLCPHPISNCAKGTASTAAVELPLVAAAYRVTGEAEFRDRALAQLQEMTRWSPLQRPGWTCYQRGNRLPPDGKDGAWLATGSGVVIAVFCRG